MPDYDAGVTDRGNATDRNLSAASGRFAMTIGGFETIWALIAPDPSLDG
jgi:hypothetical protein